MLNEIDSLSHNIARLIAMVDEGRKQLQRVEKQLAHVRAERDTARDDLQRTVGEREALREERDGLNSKIDDAQVRLNAILEKLPRHKPNENQLDLLAPEPKPPLAGETHDH